MLQKSESINDDVSQKILDCSRRSKGSSGEIREMFSQYSYFCQLDLIPEIWPSITLVVIPY